MEYGAPGSLYVFPPASQPSAPLPAPRLQDDLWDTSLLKVAVALVLIKPLLVRNNGRELVQETTVDCNLHNSQLIPMPLIFRVEVIDLSCTHDSSTETRGSNFRNFRSCFSPWSRVRA